MYIHFTQVIHFCFCGWLFYFYNFAFAVAYLGNFAFAVAYFYNCVCAVAYFGNFAFAVAYLACPLFKFLTVREIFNVNLVYKKTPPVSYPLVL